MKCPHGRILEDDNGVFNQAMTNYLEFLVGRPTRGRVSALGKLIHSWSAERVAHSTRPESVPGTAMTYRRMNSALREWLDLQDGVPNGTVDCGINEHSTLAWSRASMTTKSARARRLGP